MADTIIGYVKKYGDYTFAEKPMNEVDSLVLCQFSYLKFDGMVPGVHENRAFVSMRQLAAHADYEHLFDDTRYEKNNRALFEAMLGSKRFGRMKMNCYINIVETEWETQFAAITFLLEDGTVYVAYRGTDESIIGWKEDFNMAFLFPIPAQEYSMQYLNMVGDRIWKPFYVGGHSKGGNLAVYAAMRCVDKVRDRIRKIYCMDGPGFREDALEKCGYEKIAGRLVKILPHSSMVGMIFETDTRYRVVESKTFGLLQHDPYTWLVEEDHFVYVDELFSVSKMANHTLNQWILSLNEEQLRTFVDTVYQVVSVAKVDNLIEFAADLGGNLRAVVSAMRDLDKDTKKVLKEMVRSLAVMSREGLRLPGARAQAQSQSMPGGKGGGKGGKQEASVGPAGAGDRQEGK